MRGVQPPTKGWVISNQTETFIFPISDSEFELKTANLESSRTPVHELNAPLALDCYNGGVHVLRHNIAAVQHAAGHVLACKQKMKPTNFGIVRDLYYHQLL